MKYNHQRFVSSEATANCNTRTAGCLIECSKCRMHYRGEMVSYKSHCLEQPVARHFNLPSHSLNELIILVIEKVDGEDTCFQKIMESHWIQGLQSMASIMDLTLPG